MSKTIGTKMASQVPPVVQGFGESNFFRLFTSWAGEVKEYLETPLPIDKGPWTVAIGATQGVADSTMSLLWRPPKPFLLEVNTATSSATTQNSASVSPNAERTQIVWVDVRATVAPTSISVSGAGLTWTQKATISANNCRISMFVATAGTPTPGALTFTATGATAISSYGWAITEWQDLDTAANAVVQSVTGSSGTSPLSITLAAFSSAINVTVMLVVNSATGVTQTPKSGFTLLGSNGTNSQTIGLEYLLSADTNPTMSYSAGTGTGIASELKTLVKRPFWATAAAGGRVRLPIVLRVNDRISAINIYERHVGAGQWTFNVYEDDMTNASTVPNLIGTVNSATGSTADETVSITGLAQFLAAGKQYYIDCISTGVADQRLYGASVTFDRPI